MEFNWAQTLVEIGWTHSVFRLGSRTPVVGPQPTYVMAFYPPIALVGLLTLVSPPFAWSQTNFPIPPAAPHYPYGRIVEPPGLM